ncbi:MAG: NAD(P)/FAD-dependent oxidoreductase [Gammaproteobacteria bacterium]|nr:NAD(P)/FAD-dependent oxidoreductase [Gammaproteobacteria bacterium]MBT4492645.1 NAD(P)/FAD-dependent oxidoreductase [Gammaproteobacteria bacterium]MBT7371314.1 NAD(P)/FAD-dependent oxidoreductase [Gammaproteobacteria bacterium]
MTIDKSKTNWDVVVVGGGPGGALAAKRCAEAGLDTLLLEKRRMPRDKVCTGMVMAQWGQDIVQQEFGEYPDWVEEETIYLAGYALHVPGAETLSLDIRTPTTWRHTLDTWMCESARDAGAEIWDNARLSDLKQEAGRSVLQIKIGAELFELETQFVIGADGAFSTVRNLIYPEFRPPIRVGYRVYFETLVDLPSDRFNMFTAGLEEIFFVHNKGDAMLLEGVAQEGTVDETIERCRQYLIENYALDPDIKPSWRDGCAQPVVSPFLWNGQFRPAEGNVLLVGDAAGVNAPISGEGLTMALKSGVHAAEAVVESHQGNELAEGPYLRKIDEILEVFREISAHGQRIVTALESEDPNEFAEAMLSSWDRSLNAF